MRILAVATILQRSGPLSRRAVLCLLLLCALFFPSSAQPEFDPSGWLRFREIRIPTQIQQGLVGVALESDVLARCKEDLSDIRIASSDGTLVPMLITPSVDAEEPTPFPARIFRVSKKPGKWTEIWIDKGGKILSREVILETSSKDFIRRVELRGSDNSKDAYVILMDGLVIDLAKPFPLRSLGIPHHLNAHQYLQLRILDEEQAPLKIDNVLCRPPASGSELMWPLDVRMIENRVAASTSSTVIVADLGERRFPVMSVKISTGSKSFTKTARVSGSNSESSGTWEKLYEGSIYRVSKEDAVKESLSAHFRPQACRYIKVELSGPGAPVTVSQLEAQAAVRLAIFEYRQGLNYRLHYENPGAKSIDNPTLNLTPNVQTLASIAAELKLGQEQRGLPAPAVTAMTNAHEEAQPSSLRKIAGIILLLVGLLLLFGMMLKARSERRMNVRVGSRTFTTRL